MLIEPVPHITQDEALQIGQQAFSLLLDSDYQALIRHINNDYLYWDKAKYHCPKSIDPKVFWMSIKYLRLVNIKPLVFGEYTFSYTITDRMLSLLNQFDMNFGGILTASSLIPEQDKQMFLVNSIMEEAIASSQMEGANTTRKVAKDMLRKQHQPRNKGQQMILNNYETIRYISEHRNDEFNVANIKIIHASIAKNTLDDSSLEGVFRDNDDVVVQNSVTGTIVHRPPTFTQVEQMIEELCAFANDESSEGFIHPIIKAIIIHFMLAYIHPFADGNGRTARSLFYWYLLKKGYWLTEYLSISRIIHKSKTSYEKAFIYTESDTNDISYFIHYNLNAMQKSFDQLKQWLQQQTQKRQAAQVYTAIDGVNDRQGYLLRLFADQPSRDIRVKEAATRFNVTSHTARADLQNLVELGLLREIALDKKTKSYVRVSNFDELLQKMMK